MPIRRSSFRAQLIVSVIALCAYRCPLLAATSVSQFGITWTFDRDYAVGQYANGDSYVVGPVTIIGISPASVVVSGRTTNGSWINPTSGFALPPGVGFTQPFDSAMYGSTGPFFDAALNAARPGGNNLSASNPLVVPAGSSLVSSISHPTAGFRPQLTDAAILTVVSAAPPSGSFRPPYAGTNKTHSWNKSSLNYNILRSLAPVASTPVLATVEATVERPQLEFHTSSFSQYTHPINNGPNYGREIAWNMADAVLSLHLNYTNAQKERLFIRVVQIGIDIYGCAAFSGGRWLDLDGINIGRKLPVVIAGLALNDPAILSYADATQHKATDGHFLFSEDGQTFVVTQADVGRLPYIGDGQTREAYIQADVGLPEWGGQHIHGGGTRDGRNWATMAYRDIAGAPGIATALSVHLTRGARAAWNWQPFFDYADRYILDPITGGGASILPFHQNMWNAYRGLASGPARNAVVRP